MRGPTRAGTVASRQADKTIDEPQYRSSRFACAPARLVHAQHQVSSHSPPARRTAACRDGGFGLAAGPREQKMNREQPALQSNDATAESNWEFVRLHEYRVPSVPARSAAAKAWASFKGVFRHAADDAQAPIKKEAELRALPEVRLQHLVPPIDWTAAAQALDVALADSRFSSAATAAVPFVIGQPHCGHTRIVGRWGEGHDAVPIEAPTVEQILAGDRRWFDAWPAPDRPWVLPNLERCYLRHARGLALVRELLARVAGGNAGRGLIGCDSWAWAYLQRVWPLAKSDALTLQAFDGDRLSRLFAQLASPRQTGRLRFRNASTGHDLLSVPTEPEQASAEIVRLAAHCRGNVGTARSYWREQLRDEPEEEGKDLAANAPAPQTGEPQDEVVWVSAALPGPTSPIEADEDTAFVLHALLLHDGLPATLLPELLPLALHRCLAVLLRLQDLGLVQLRGERWAVDALGYALVRELLRGRDYLTDDF